MTGEPLRLYNVQLTEVRLRLETSLDDEVPESQTGSLLQLLPVSGCRRVARRSSSARVGWGSPPAAITPLLSHRATRSVVRRLQLPTIGSSCVGASDGI